MHSDHQSVSAHRGCIEPLNLDSRVGLMLRDIQRLVMPGAIIGAIILIVLVLKPSQEPSAEEIAMMSVAILAVALWIARAVAGAIAGYPGRRPLREGDVSDLKK